MKKRNSQVSFKQLQAEWDKRLADSGFVDIESRKTGKIVPTGSVFYYPPEIVNKGLPLICDGKYSSLAVKRSQEEYYRRACQFLHDGGLTGRTKKVWALHAEGLPYREVAKRLGVHYDTVKEHVHKGRLACFGPKVGKR